MPSALENRIVMIGPCSSQVLAISHRPTPAATTGINQISDGHRRRATAAVGSSGATAGLVIGCPPDPRSGADRSCAPLAASAPRPRQKPMLLDPAGPTPACPSGRAPPAG